MKNISPLLVVIVLIIALTLICVAVLIMPPDLYQKEIVISVISGLLGMVGGGSAVHMVNQLEGVKDESK